MYNEMLINALAVLMHKRVTIIVVSAEGPQVGGREVARDVSG